jgi:deoxyribodipyrimidine photolyase-related protein
VDGLYWRFIENNRDFFAKNPRLGLMLKSLDRMKEDRKIKIYNAADDFIARNTS